MNPRTRLSLLCGALVLPLLLPSAPARSYAVTNPWNLDRINQTNLPLDGNASVGSLTGAGTDVYVVDTGVRPTHEQLNGRVVGGLDVPSLLRPEEAVSPLSSDCDGHGTHVASTIAGLSTGVATGARIISVRVLNCDGNGEVEEVVQALQWIRSHHRSGRAAVANLSLGVDLGDDGTTIIEMVHRLIADGIVVVVAAGNGDGTGKGIDACRIAPGSEPLSLTVGAVTRNDSAAPYSNYGPCVDLYAPGGDRTTPVNAAWYRSDSDYMGDIGTSMAAPLVSGYVALLAGQQPTLCPAQLSAAVVARATPNVITGIDGTSPNRLLYVDTSPVTTLQVPDRPSNVLVTPDSSSLLVSWENPCDGGSPLVSTRASLLYAGRVVKRMTVAPDRTAVRFRGLVPGRRYSVVLKASNALGPGDATRRIGSPRVASLRAGRSVNVDNLITGETDSETVITSLTPKRCRVRGVSSPLRLYGVSAGTCRYAIRTTGSQVDVVRTITVSR